MTPHRRKQIEWYMALLALLTIAIAWWAGKKNWEEKQLNTLTKVYPDSLYDMTPLGENCWLLEGKETENRAYISTGKAKGYAGPIKVATRFNHLLKIEDVHILSASETPSYFRRVKNKDFTGSFRDRPYDYNMTQIAETNAVSGATKTCTAIARATRKSSIKITRHLDHVETITPEEPPVRFGAKETIIILLFLLGMISYLPHFKYKKLLRWITLSSGLLLLGFIYNSPITLTHINSILAGFWPDWHTEIYVYLLIFGLLVILLTSGKNPYCSHICPFGAMQEILGRLGKAKPLKTRAVYLWIWLQRSVAWIAILIALATRNPGISDYVVFGAAFQLTGSHIMFILLGSMIILSLVVHRPWCNFLCPVRPVTDYIKTVRNKLIKPWIHGS